MAKQAEVLAKIEANLHRAIQRQDLATQVTLSIHNHLFI